MSRSPTRAAPPPAAAAIYLRMLRDGIALGVLLALAFTFSSSHAQSVGAAAAPCVPGEAGCLLSGGFGSISTTDPNPISGPWISAAEALPFGALIYADFVQIEQTAREKLKCGLQVREDISPYKGRETFSTFLAKMQGEADFTDIYPGQNCWGSNLTFLQIVNKVEQSLGEARNLYAFLAVFAPQARFRIDPAYVNTGGPTLCGSTDKENPDPPDPNFTGLVQDPIVDWCNFRARMRQSVREAANMHMIIGQQFMVKALGMQFSANIDGSETYVRLEVAQLRAAKRQFELAENFLAAGLKIAVGNGCLVTDFYTQPEWSLLSRAVDQQGVAQYAAASRLSYLGISSPSGVAAARDTAKQAYQGGAADVYLKLAAMAALMRQDTGRCTIGEHPNGAGVADMALNMIDAQRQVADMQAGLNIFGFDVTFTPARAYKSTQAVNCQTNAGDRGLWDQAMCSAEIAKEMQTRLEGLERDFDNSQTALRAAVNEINLGLDLKMDDVVGCNRQDIGNDPAFFACVDTQISKGLNCVELSTGSDEVFNACMADNNLNKDNDASTALFELRSAYKDWQSVLKAMQQINDRIKGSNAALQTTKTPLVLAGAAETASRLSQAALDAADCVDNDNVQSIATSGAECGGVAVANKLAQTAAGVASALADVKALDAEYDKEVLNLNLDQNELKISADMAHQAFLAKKSDVTGMYTALRRDFEETKRQRAYFASSPANDPAFRIVRDSQRLQLAEAMQQAAQLAYLAARRAEYEYAAVLAKSNFRISDIYRARVPQDVIIFLNKLSTITNNLAGSTQIESTPIDITISVAHDVLKLTDDYLIREGFTTPEAIQAERLRRFRAEVGKNTTPCPPDKPNCRPVLTLEFPTSLLNNGLIARKLPEGYDRRWRILVAGVNSPIPASGGQQGSTGISVNVLTAQTGNFSYRNVAVTQEGTVHLISAAGCPFDYKLIAPAALLGLEWAEGQDPEQTTSLFKGNVNGTNPFTANGFRSGAFEGRAISSTKWKIEIFSGSPEPGSLPDMDLQQLTDIQLLVSATYSSRQPSGLPSLAACTRIDF